MPKNVVQLTCDMQIINSDQVLNKLILSCCDFLPVFIIFFFTSKERNLWPTEKKEKKTKHITTYIHNSVALLKSFNLIDISH